MGSHGRAAAYKLHITKHNGKCWMEWCKARHHWTVEQWSVFCGVMNHASLSGSVMDESEFGECQENVTCLTALPTVKFGGGGIML